MGKGAAVLSDLISFDWWSVLAKLLYYAHETSECEFVKLLSASECEVALSGAYNDSTKRHSVR
jgi:hypothetical protein